MRAICVRSHCILKLNPRGDFHWTLTQQAINHTSSNLAFVNKANILRSAGNILVSANPRSKL